ncbi:hypothetical protein HYV10_00480 [Candidatus Dependentiae bacterium]|nr:hypothetical protein [Candidatus Dependentiae bacterium]
MIGDNYFILVGFGVFLNKKIKILALLFLAKSIVSSDSFSAVCDKISDEDMKAIKEEVLRYRYFNLVQQCELVIKMGQELLSSFGTIKNFALAHMSLDDGLDHSEGAMRSFGVEKLAENCIADMEDS